MLKPSLTLYTLFYAHCTFLTDAAQFTLYTVNCTLDYNTVHQTYYCNLYIVPSIHYCKLYTVPQYITVNCTLYPNILL